MTITLDHTTVTAETHVQHHLSAGTALHAAIARGAEHPVADARLIAAAFAHEHQLPTGTGPKEPDTTGDLIQIVDALVANAIGHAIWPDEHATVELTLTRIGDAIVIEVEDPDFRNMPIWPSPGTYADLALLLLDDPDISPDDVALSRGRGLVDVAARAETTTSFREGNHKVVRAIIAVGPDQSGGAR